MLAKGELRHLALAGFRIDAIRHAQIGEGELLGGPLDDRFRATRTGVEGFLGGFAVFVFVAHVCFCLTSVYCFPLRCLNYIRTFSDVKGFFRLFYHRLFSLLPFPFCMVKRLYLYAVNVNI